MQYHGKIPWATTNHVPKPCARPKPPLTQSLVKVNLNITLTIPPLNLTWSNHQLPSNFYQGISHTPPYHLGLSLRLYRWVTRGMHALPGLTVICSFTCKLLHYNFFYFLCAFMVTTPSPSVASSSRFTCSPFYALHSFQMPCLPHFYHTCHMPSPTSLTIIHKTMNHHFMK